MQARGSTRRPDYCFSQLGLEDTKHGNKVHSNSIAKITLQGGKMLSVEILLVFHFTCCNFNVVMFVITLFFYAKNLTVKYNDKTNFHILKFNLFR